MAVQELLDFFYLASLFQIKTAHGHKGPHDWDDLMYVQEITGEKIIYSIQVYLTVRIVFTNTLLRLNLPLANAVMKSIGL